MLLGCSEAGDRRPNLLLVTLDTTRADRLGCYGYEGADTPTLDALAARGTVFDEAYSPAPMTLPVHATLMTGLLPPQHGARVNGEHRLAEDVPTLAETLSASGYRTGAFVAAFVLDDKFGLGRGFDEYDDDLSGAYAQEVAETLSSYRPGNLVVDAALDWLDTEGATAPFFAWVHLYDAHYPWHPHGPGSEDAEPESGTYDGEVAFEDRQVARLLAWLAEKGIADDTLVVAVADHGEGLGDHHEIEHAYLLNEEVLHVPWIVAGPGVAAGHRVPALVALEDFVPTALELLRMPPMDTEAPGRSLVAALRGESIRPGMSYAETDLPWTSYRWSPQRSLTTEEWKYVRTAQPELYDRATDRAELVNLVEVKKDVRDRLEARLAGMQQELGERESSVAAVSAEELGHLAALGYVAGSSAVEAPESLADLADVKQRFAAKDLATELRRRLADNSVEPPEALGMARQLVGMSPETPSFHGQLGSALVNLGEIDAGIEQLARYVALDPGNASAHYDLGDVLQQQGRQVPARHAFEAALALDPEHSAAHVGMGNVLRSEGRPDLAAGYYTEALDLRPGYPEAYFNLAQTYVDRGQLARAVENFRAALEHRPGWAMAHSTLAYLLASNGRPAEAIEHYEGALASAPGDADLHNDLGVALDTVGRVGEAKAHYDAAVRARPGFYRPHINLANQAWAGGNDAVALQEYEEALRLEPAIAETASKLARFLATSADETLRDAERAVQLAERAAELTGWRHARVLDTLGAAYAAAGRYADAETAAQRARQSARLEGDEVLATAIDQRLALYGEGRPFVEPRAQTMRVEDDGG